jgi:Tfp pilus assembly protein PilF
MKNQCLFYLLALFFCITGCGKKKNERLAMNYYQLSSMELNKKTDGYYRQALLYLDLALKEDPRPEFLARKATILFRLEAYDESQEIFHSLLRSKLSSDIRDEVLNNYACLLAQQGKNQDALKFLNDLVRSKNYLTPEVAMVNQGKIYMEMGKEKEAQKRFTQATKAAYNYVDAHYYLALVSNELGDRQQVEQSVQTTLLIEPEHCGAKILQNKILQDS